MAIEELTRRVDVLEANDNATRETLDDILEGQRAHDLRFEEIHADVKDLKTDVKGLKTDMKRIILHFGIPGDPPSISPKAKRPAADAK